MSSDRTRLCSKHWKKSLPNPLLSETSCGYPGLIIVLRCFSSSHWLKSMLCTATRTMKRINLQHDRKKDGRSIFQIPKQFYHLWRSCFLLHAHLLEQIHTLHPSTVSFMSELCQLWNQETNLKWEENTLKHSVFTFTFCCQQTKGASFLNSNTKCSSLHPSQHPCLQL